MLAQFPKRYVPIVEWDKSDAEVRQVSSRALPLRLHRAVAQSDALWLGGREPPPPVTG